MPFKWGRSSKLPKWMINLFQLFGIQLNLSHVHSDLRDVPQQNLIPPFSAAGSSRTCIMPASWCVNNNYNPSFHAIFVLWSNILDCGHITASLTFVYCVKGVEATLSRMRFILKFQPGSSMLPNHSLNLLCIFWNLGITILKSLQQFPNSYCTVSSHLVGSMLMFVSLA